MFRLQHGTEVYLENLAESWWHSIPRGPLRSVPIRFFGASLRAAMVIGSQGRVRRTQFAAAPVFVTTHYDLCAGEEPRTEVLPEAGEKWRRCRSAAS